MPYFMLLALISTSCQNDRQLAQPQVTKTRQLIAATAQDNRLFEKTFRLFVSERNLVGLRAIIRDSTPKNMDRVRELILADKGIDAEFADQTYPLLRKILREKSHQSHLVKVIVGDELAGAVKEFTAAVRAIFLEISEQKVDTQKFLEISEQKVDMQKEVSGLSLSELFEQPLYIPDQLLPRLDMALSELEIAYGRYSHMHVNIARDSNKLSHHLRRDVDRSVALVSETRDFKSGDKLSDYLNLKAELPEVLKRINGTLYVLQGVLLPYTFSQSEYDMLKSPHEQDWPIIFSLFPSLHTIAHRNHEFSQLVGRAQAFEMTVLRDGIWPDNNQLKD